MKNLIYKIANETIEMPQTYCVEDWKKYFTELMDKNPVAPKYAVYYCFSIVCNEEVATVTDSDTGLYYDTGIELCADDRYPAEEAAIAVGFFEEGIRQIVDEAANDSEYKDDYMAIVRTIFKSTWCEDFVAKEVVQKAYRLLADEMGRFDCDASDGVLFTEPYWNAVLQDVILADPNAAVSVLGYFLEVATGKYCTIFCPRGDIVYKQLGKDLFDFSVLFEVAKTSGFFASGISTYFGAALDNVDNWNVQYFGIKYILNHPELRCMVHARDLYVAECLLQFGADDNTEVTLWDGWVKSISEKFKKEIRGY